MRAGHAQPTILLRGVEPSDLPVLFAHQLDAEANRLAGTKPFDTEAWRATWERIRSTGVIARAIMHDRLIVGGLWCFKRDGADFVGYWIGKEHWGRGFASRGLAIFLDEVRRRPLHATAARANAPSIRVLEKCGFRLTGYHTRQETDRFVACEIASFVLE